MLKDITITFTIDTDDYSPVCEETLEIVGLVSAMIEGEADFPDHVVIICNGEEFDCDIE